MTGTPHAPLIRGAVAPGVTARSPELDRHCFGFVDPSGGRSDSFTAAIAHAEPAYGDPRAPPTLVLDASLEIRSPFDSLNSNVLARPLVQRFQIVDML